MKRNVLITLALMLVFSVSSFAATIPFEDPFDASGPKADWETDTAGTAFPNGVFSAVSSDTDWRGTTVNPPAGSDGYMAKLSNAPAAAGTAWRLVGAGTEKDYAIQCKVYAPVVNAESGADAYLYQMIIFNQNAAGYARLHFQFNENTTAIAKPRIRLQASHSGSLASRLILESPDNFTHQEKWYDVRLLVNATANTTTFYLDNVEKGVADHALDTRVEGSFSNGGKCGVGMYINGDTAGLARTTYFDAFKWTNLPPTSVSDWTMME